MRGSRRWDPFCQWRTMRISRTQWLAIATVTVLVTLSIIILANWEPTSQRTTLYPSKSYSRKESKQLPLTDSTEESPTTTVFTTPSDSPASSLVTVYVDRASRSSRTTRESAPVAPAGTAAPPTSPAQPSPPATSVDATTSWRVSEASWYGPGFYGNGTACGQRYNEHIMGVAHKSLPCGTMVEFEYRGRHVTVPVIDRGPYTRGRTWDLSAGACRALAHCHTGPIAWRLAS